VSGSKPHPDLRLDGLTVRVPEHAAPVLRDATLRMDPGSVTGLLGRSGVGKTTLLHSISGLLPWLRSGEVHGTIELAGENIGDLDPGQRAHLIASCLDRAFAQLFLSTPREELAAARRLYGGAPILDAAVDEFDLGAILDRRIAELSSGERQRLALAVTLAGCPRPVLLDEPTAHLDTSAVAALGRLLARLVEHGGSTLLAEQAGWRLGTTVSEWQQVEDGRLEAQTAPSPPPLAAPTHEAQAEPTVRLHGVTVARGGRRLIEKVDLSLRAGEIVLLSGPNGAGKSTLAEVIAGFRRPAEGRIERQGRVALMQPTAEFQLFATTVADEVAARGDREAQARVLRRHRLEHLSARAPWTLSRGERQRLVHAALDLGRPSLMVIDEPAQGLDPEEMAELIRLIHRRAERGRAYLMISHREELAAAAHRHLSVRDGHLVEDG
jgi:energy-coupling factor transport system ATP-binding protein